MANQFRYQKGNTMVEEFRTPPQNVMQGSVAPPFCSAKQFAIKVGDMLFLDELSGCVYPAKMMSEAGTTFVAATAAAWQSQFAAVFVGIAEEKIGLSPGEFSPNPNGMYQDSVKVATAAVFEMDCPNQIFPNYVAPLGIAATAAGIVNSQTVDLLEGTNTTTTNSYTSVQTSIAVASAAGIAAGAVIQVATNTGTTTTTPANITTSIPASGSGAVGTATGSQYIPLVNGNGIGPGTTLQIGAEAIYVTAMSGISTATTATNAASAVATNFNVGSTQGMAIGCVLLIGTELMTVNEVNPAGPSVSVTRGAFGSTAALFAAGAGVTVYPVATVTRGFNQTVAATIGATATVEVITSPPELMLVTNVVGSTLTVTRGYNGTTASAIANGAIVTLTGSNLLQRIGTIAPTWGMNRNIAAGAPQNRVCVNIRPNLIAGGILVSG
jgi:hypothetical protein